MSAFGAHTGIDVFLRHAGEAEGRGDVAVGDGEGAIGPDIGGRLPVFAEFDAYVAVGDGGPVGLRRLADDFRGLGGLHAAGAVIARVGARADLGDLGLRDGRKGRGEALGDLFGRHQRAVEADIIDQAAEAAVGRTAHRGTDPDRGVVDHGRVGRLAVHVPRAFDLLAVDPAADALRLAEFVTHRDMVPASVVGEARRGGPAVPLDAAAGRRREEEVEARGLVEDAEAQRPVLVAGVGGLRIGTSLADDIGVLAFAQAVGLHPGFEGDGIAVLEVEDAGGAGVLNLEVGAFAVERSRYVGLFETRIIRSARTRLLERHAARGDEFRSGRPVERPRRHRLGRGHGGETEEKGSETAHLQMGQGRDGGCSAGGSD